MVEKELYLYAHKLTLWSTCIAHDETLAKLSTMFSQSSGVTKKAK